MTAPLQEGSVYRTQSGQQWNISQLARRPQVTSAYTIPGFFAYGTTDVSLTSGNSVQLKWDVWSIDDTSVFEEGLVSGGLLTDVKLLLDGWYSIFAWIEWAFNNEPASGFAGIAMIHDDTDIAESNNFVVQGVSYPVNFSSAPVVQFSSVRYLPPVYLTQQTPSFAWADRLEFWAVQNSGVSRTITANYCNIGYLGPRP